MEEWISAITFGGFVVDDLNVLPSSTDIEAGRVRDYVNSSEDGSILVGLIRTESEYNPVPAFIVKQQESLLCSLANGEKKTKILSEIDWKHEILFIEPPSIQFRLGTLPCDSFVTFRTFWKGSSLIIVVCSSHGQYGEIIFSQSNSIISLTRKYFTSSTEITTIATIEDYCDINLSVKDTMLYIETSVYAEIISIDIQHFSSSVTTKQIDLPQINLENNLPQVSKFVNSFAMGSKEEREELMDGVLKLLEDNNQQEIGIQILQTLHRTKEVDVLSLFQKLDSSIQFYYSLNVDYIQYIHEISRTIHSVTNKALYLSEECCIKIIPQSYCDKNMILRNVSKILVKVYNSYSNSDCIV